MFNIVNGAKQWIGWDHNTIVGGGNLTDDHLEPWLKCYITPVDLAGGSGQTLDEYSFSNNMW